MMLFSSPGYPVVWTPGFVLVWGTIISAALTFGGLLHVAYVLSCLLILLTHEAAHAAECRKSGIPIHEIRICWWGGLVNADIEKSKKAALRVLLAGVKDTGMYALGFSAMFLAWEKFGHYFAGGLRWLILPEVDYLRWMAQFSIIAFACLVVPGTLNHKVHGPIRTDGWAAWKYWRSAVDDGKGIPDSADTLSG